MKNKRHFKRGTISKLVHYQHCLDLFQYFGKMHVMRKIKLTNLTHPNQDELLKEI